MLTFDAKESFLQYTDREGDIGSQFMTDSGLFPCRGEGGLDRRFALKVSSEDENEGDSSDSTILLA